MLAEIELLICTAEKTGPIEIESFETNQPNKSN